MDDVTEYTEYAQPRWPALVRSAMVLGCDFEEAVILHRSRCFAAT